MNNEEVRLECSPKLVKGHSEVNCAHPPQAERLAWALAGPMQTFQLVATCVCVCVCVCTCMKQRYSR